MSEATSMSMILALPEELQVEILLCAALRVDEPIKSPHIKADLMKICRYWAALVLSTPKFWSTIVIHTELDSEAIALAIAQALKWKQSLRLVVDTEWSTSPLEARWTPEKDWANIYGWCSMLTPLQSIADYVHTLDVHAFDQLRTSLVLESIGLELVTDLASCRLRADSQPMFGWPASLPVCNRNIALKELTCSKVNPTWKTPFVYASLTRLSLVEIRGGLSYDDFKTIIACAKILEYLELSGTLLSQEDPGIPVVEFFARRVRVFTLGVGWGPASYVPAGLQLPALETFTLRAPSGSLGGDIVALCIDYLQTAAAFVVECKEPDEDWLSGCTLALHQAKCIDVRTIVCPRLERWVTTCAAMPFLSAVVLPADETTVLEALLREKCPAVAIYVPVLRTGYFREATVSGHGQLCYLPDALQNLLCPPHVGERAEDT
ncbi:hypothetical protein R3P38DRAFT_3182499 [Favolaschia claudopus]|uniref:F-box domain-containing protein n=1 Tax=Favolaschia claudopus TaxID=2862362 RepID=A0AAW0CHW2_9AGAR